MDIWIKKKNLPFFNGQKLHVTINQLVSYLCISLFSGIWSRILRIRLDLSRFLKNFLKIVEFRTDHLQDCGNIKHADKMA